MNENENEAKANEITSWVLEQWRFGADNAMRMATGMPLVQSQRDTSLFMLIREALDAKDASYTSNLKVLEEALEEIAEFETDGQTNPIEPSDEAMIATQALARVRSAQ